MAAGLAIWRLRLCMARGPHVMRLVTPLRCELLEWTRSIGCCNASFFSACCDFKPQCCVYSTSTSYNSVKSCVAGINSLLSLLAVHICMVHVTTYVQRVACCPLESYSHVTNAAACRLLSTCVLFACYQCCGMPLVVHLSRIHMSPMLRHVACCPLVYYSRVTSVAACCLLST